MTFNIHADTALSRVLDGLNSWQRRRERVVRVLAASGCDILGLQECIARQWDYLSYALADRYDTYGQGSDGGMQGEITPIFWKRERFELLATETFWLNAELKPWERMAGARRNRICSAVRLQCRLTGRQITIYNTHFDHRRGRAGDELRTRSAELVLRKMRAAGFARSVLLGDLNCRPGSDTCCLLETSLVDSFAAINTIKSCDRPSTFRVRGDHGLLHLDFIYCTPDLTVEDYEIVCTRGGEGKLWPSDHYPVRARLGF